MPAQPGYFVIYAASPEKAGGDWQTFRSPVVGWIVIEDPYHVGSVFGSLPIVASVNYREDIWALLTPGGTVYMPYSGMFDKRWKLVGKPEERGARGKEQKTGAEI